MTSILLTFRLLLFTMVRAQESVSDEGSGDVSAGGPGVVENWIQMAIKWQKGYSWSQKHWEKRGTDCCGGLLHGDSDIRVSLGGNLTWSWMRERGTGQPMGAIQTKASLTWGWSLLKVCCVPGTMLVTFTSRAWHVNKIQNIDYEDRVHGMEWQDRICEGPDWRLLSLYLCRLNRQGPESSQHSH